MDFISRVLFGRFPREAGIPRRFTLFSEDHFDDFLDRAAEHSHNTYATLAHFDPVPRCDKVSFDLDSPAKAGTGSAGDWDHPDIPSHAGDSEVIDLMRADPDLADEVLGPVVEDMRELAAESIADDIPTVGVYTGFGIHVHQLYQETRNPREEMLTTANKFADELDLASLDRKPVGDVKRIMRIPNAQRFDGDEPCGLWTIPLSAEEMRGFGPQDLLEWSSTPRHSFSRAALAARHSRPEMTVHEDYLYQSGYTAPQRPLEEDIDHDLHGEAEYWVRQYIAMPCVRERALQPDPDHKTRLQVAIHLFNAGCSPERTLEIIRGLNWSDFDTKTTRKQLKQIWNHGYADASCSTMREEGYCVRLDDTLGCETYGWCGGQAEWTDRGALD